MALTPFQPRICLLLAEQRKRVGESYVAGGAALNELLGGTRRSRDVDLFHDTAEALAVTWERDRATLAVAGLRVTPSREGPSFVQAQVGDGTNTEVLQWVQDSAYRFFPLVENETFGLTLHPFDHATNKVLALAGRRKVRDWVDGIHCHETLQPLGYLAWAASGKDPGLSPLFILEQAARTRYVQSEIDQLDFEGPAPRAADLSGRWHHALAVARRPRESGGLGAFALSADCVAGACLSAAEGCTAATAEVSRTYASAPRRPDVPRLPRSHPAAPRLRGLRRREAGRGRQVQPAPARWPLSAPRLVLDASVVLAVLRGLRGWADAGASQRPECRFESPTGKDCPERSGRLGPPPTLPARANLPDTS